MKKDTVIIFTSDYPDIKSNEISFICSELRYLTQYFRRVIIVPFHPQKSKDLFVEASQIDNTLSSIFFPRNNLMLLKSFVWSLTNYYSAEEILANLPCLTNRVTVRKFLIAATVSYLTRAWLKRFVKANNIDIDNSIFYTYWANELTLGLGLGKEECGIKLVSRAHGSDVLRAAHVKKYIPFHGLIINFLDKIYCSSDYMRRYLARLYPGIASRLEVSYLGTIDPGFHSESSADGKFRIVSCAYLTEVKRIHLVVEVLSALSGNNPETQIEWTHLGGGPLLSQIKDLAARELPDTVTCSFTGNVPNDRVMSFYKENPVDLFLNTSHSEGLPVSIMEALSCGIPVMAPAITGILEAVDNDNGFLFPGDASARQIADVLERIIHMKESLSNKRLNARRKWQERFRADINYDGFARSLAALAN